MYDYIFQKDRSVFIQIGIKRIRQYSVQLYCRILRTRQSACFIWYSRYPYDNSPKAMRFLSNPKDWHGITRSVYGIRWAAWHHAVHVFLRLDAIRLYEPITYATSSQFHTALRADSIHGYAVIKMRKANGKGWITLVGDSAFSVFYYITSSFSSSKLPLRRPLRLKALLRKRNDHQARSL